MAYEKEIFIPAQSSIYIKDNTMERKLRVVYSIPETGMNYETGILCLVPAYGGNIDSSVYRKMRQQFADQC